VAGNKVLLEFAGDASKLDKASKQTSAALDDVNKASKGTAEQFDQNSKSSGNLLDRFNKLGGAVSGAGDAIDQASGLLDSFSQIQNSSYEQSQKQKRALLDVQQAQEDYNQAIRDSKQATLDAGQAQIDKQQADLDAAAALKQYNEDVKEHGRNSIEARQDLIDLNQAHQDAKQATEDAAQATRDGNQAMIDAKSAQLDLNDAQREAHPPDLDKWSTQLQKYTPLLSALVGVTGLTTAAQWAWNAAQLASPTTWIIVAIAALVAIIVVIATKTHWFQNIWRASWSGIRSAAASTWDFLKKIPGWLGTAFSKIGSAITAPFRWAFNYIADAWNHTIGGLHFSVPSWVPGIGGNSFGVPYIPHFHEGGEVPGPPGSNVLALLQGGETVTSVSGAGGGVIIEIKSGGSELDDVLVEVLSRAVRRRGGNVQLVLGGRNA
jgi:hypothetical protein